MTLHEGEQPIPGFRLIRRRGRGGFGEVWEAEASGGFLVALKFVRLSSRSRAAEVRALEFVRGIHHPNLLANFGSWLVDDTLIIGMELADRSLWDRHLEAIRQGYRGIPRAELLGYLGEVAAGIDHLNDYRHTHDGRTGIGVQHRDLKPPNILLFGGGAKVADLGMARAMEGEVGGHTGMWTFPYAAPEFFRGETTRQSDQYGLAVTFCQLRGGQLPFTGSTATVTAGHLFGQPDLEALPELERPIVERALAKTPGDRWSNCRAFVAALRDLPASAVPEVLVDPDGQYSSPRYAESAGDTGSSFSGGLDSSGGGLMRTGWHLETLNSSSTVDSGGDHTNLDGVTTGSSHSAGRSVSADAIPTRILPGPTSGQPPDDSASATGRRAWWVRATWAAAASALALATVAVTASSWSRDPRAVQISQDSTPASALAAQPVAPAPSWPSVGPLAAPVLPVAVAEQYKDSTPGPEPVVAPLQAPDSVPISSESASALVLPPEEPDSAPSASAPPAGDQIAPVLAGPIDMDAISSQPLPYVPDRRESGPSTRAGIAALPVASAASTPDSSSKGKLISPPVPDRSVPDPAVRPVALVASSATSGAVATITPPRPTPTDHAGAEAAFARGRALFQQNAFARAASEFDESIRLNPAHTTSYLVRAIARHRAGDPRAALADYTTVLRARPDDLTAYLSRGQAYHELGSFDRAIADFDEVIRRQSGSGEAHFRRGLARYNSGDYPGAVGDFTETLRLDRTNAYAAEFRTEAIARLNTKNAQAAPRRLAATQAPLTSPGPPHAAPGSAAVRETSHLAPPTAVAPTNGQGNPGGQPLTMPAAVRPGTNPPPVERRRVAPRRLLPWPFPKAR